MLQHYSDALLQTHFGFFVSFVNDVEPKVAQRPSHQFSDAEASRSKGVVAEFVQRWKGLVETVNASIAAGASLRVFAPPALRAFDVANVCRVQRKREDLGRCSEASSYATAIVSAWRLFANIMLCHGRADSAVCRYYTRMLDLIKNSSADSQQLLSQVKRRCVAPCSSALTPTRSLRYPS
jgi:hypothetical protein